MVGSHPQTANGITAPAERVHAPTDPRVARWFGALIAVIYGFAKLNGAQFTILDSELDKPLGDVSGFWLTWYYFGYSAVYGTLLALAQVAGGLLLTFRRTALAGALLLLPIALNIVLVDVFYGVDLGGLLTAVVWAALLIRVVYPHRERLVAAVLPPVGERRAGAGTWAARVVLVVMAFVGTDWIANENNRSPTPIDGVWVSPSVESGRAGGPADAPPDGMVRSPRASRGDAATASDGAAAVDVIDKVFFERNRAHLVVVKDTAGEYRWHHFEVGPDRGVRIWAEWLEKGELLYEGTYAADTATLVLWPADGGRASVIELKRRRGR